MRTLMTKTITISIPDDIWKTADDDALDQMTNSAEMFLDDLFADSIGQHWFAGSLLDVSVSE